MNLKGLIKKFKTAFSGRLHSLVMPVKSYFFRRRLKKYKPILDSWVEGPKMNAGILIDDIDHPKMRKHSYCAWTSSEKA
jgi:hypothetical protein